MSKRGLRTKDKKLLPTKKKCRYCLTTENLTYDHKVPLCRGGSNERKNIQVLCKRCNTTKSGLSNGDVWQLARWIHSINESREKSGNRPLAISKKEIDGA